jgi:hypothetical protein
MKRTVTLCCVLLTLTASVCAQVPGRQPSPPAPPDHGGKIESTYDGFAHETVVALGRMSVTCEAVRGLQSRLKGFCVSLQAALHCPGKQLDYVRHATLRLTFASKDWDDRHPADQRELSAVADGETLRLGRMTLVSNAVGENWLAEVSKEVLEISVPYEAFLKLSRASYVELSVGRMAFALRDKNIAALRDLGNRVKLPRPQGAALPRPQSAAPHSGANETLVRAFEQRISSVQVEGQGVVRRVLPDDNDGSRHQRFVVALSSGQTLLVAHNIDLAPRVVGLREGDAVSFSGEYEWNAKGGVIHWTHRDPQNHHPAGWIKHNGEVYQ